MNIVLSKNGTKCAIFNISAELKVIVGGTSIYQNLEERYIPSTKDNY